MTEKAGITNLPPVYTFQGIFGFWSGIHLSGESFGFDNGFLCPIKTSIMKLLPLPEFSFRKFLTTLFVPLPVLRYFYILLFMACAFSCTKNSTPDTTATGDKTLSFAVQADVHITGSSDVYQDDYQDSVSFRLDVQGMTVSISDIVNQRPKVTPPSGGIIGGTTAQWIPDTIGVTNIIGEQAGLAYDSAGKKLINIYFLDEKTVSPGWLITYPATGTITVDSAPTPGFPSALTFVSSDEVQTLKPLEGTGSIIQVVYTITPIH
jgi:hypothetical protein